MFLIQIAISTSQISRKFIFKLRSLSRISCGLIIKNQQVEEFLLKMSLVFLFVCLKETSTCKERPLETQNGCFLHNKATCQRTRSNSTSKLQRSYLSSCNIQGANSTTLHCVMVLQCSKKLHLLSRLRLRSSPMNYWPKIITVYIHNILQSRVLCINIQF